MAKEAPEGTGSLICTKGSTSSGSNCNSCGTWRVLVWKNGSGDPYAPEKTFNTHAGYYYGGHNPCGYEEESHGQGYPWDEIALPHVIRTAKLKFGCKNYATSILTNVL